MKWQTKEKLKTIATIGMLISVSVFLVGVIMLMGAILRPLYPNLP